MHPFTSLILQADTFTSGAIESHVFATIPNGRVLHSDHCDEASCIVQREAIQLLVTSLDATHGDVLDFLFLHLRAPRKVPYVLVTTGRCAPRVLLCLRRLAVQGLFDAVRERPESIRSVIDALIQGSSSWSPRYTDDLCHKATRALLNQLAPCEELGLAVLGDGCGDHAAAAQLGMQLSSVRTLRKRIYAKLGVHDKEDMMRAAARLGYTRFTQDGVTGLGLGPLVADYLRNSKRSTMLSPALLKVCGMTADLPGEPSPGYVAGENAQ